MKGLRSDLLSLLALLIMTPLVAEPSAHAACPEEYVALQVKQRDAAQAKVDAQAACVTIAKERCLEFANCGLDKEKTKVTYPQPFAKEHTQGWDVSYDETNTLSKKYEKLKAPIKVGTSNPIRDNANSLSSFECLIACKEALAITNHTTEEDHLTNELVALEKILATLETLED
jgi:hypothetical protein